MPTVDPSTPCALAGLLVAELGGRTGASVCCSLLAQLGATVVAIEPRQPRPDPGNLSVKWNWRDQMLAGKLSLYGDGKDRALAARLLECADVVVTSSDLARQAQAFGWRRLPDQVSCDVTAWGGTGPYAGQPDCDAQIQAMTGITGTTGLPDADPLSIPVPILEYLCGVHAAGAVLAARRLVERGGPGQHIDMSLYDCGFNAMSSFFSRLLVDGGGDKVCRMGNRHTLSAPWNVYRASDGWILVCTGSNIQWRRLCQLMGKPQLGDDARYRNSVDRVARVEEVDEIVQQWVGAQTLDQCVAAFAQASIPGGPVAPIDGYPREPNLAHREMIRRLEGACAAQPAYAPGSPLRMSRTPGRALARVPIAGGDGAEIEGLLDTRVPAQRASVLPASAPLHGLRVLEIGHYTTAPIAARHLAAFGAQVTKIEPPEGEAARNWAPFDRGQSVFYTVSNSDKQCLTLDLKREGDRAVLRELIERADVLIENLKPNTLAKLGFSAADIAAINPRMVYCAVSGFGAESIYASRPAFDTVVQGMSGLMDLVRSSAGVPMKTGMSIADVMGAAMSVVAILGALAYRDGGGSGQFIDLSMQDIVAWATQTAWNGQAAGRPAHVAGSGSGDIVHAGGRLAPVRTPAQVIACEQTAARRLHFQVEDERGRWPALAVPLPLQLTPPAVVRPGPQLARDNTAILASLHDRPTAGMP